MRAPTVALAVSLALAVSPTSASGQSRTQLGPSPLGSCRTVIPSHPGTTTPVRWTAPSHAAELAALNDWCSSVGPALVVPPADSRLPTAVSEFVVVTWNVHVGAGDVVDLVERLRAGHFTEGRPVDRFALLLQETYRNGESVPRHQTRHAAAKAIRPHTAGGRMDVTAVARALRLSLYYVPSMRNGPAQLTDEDRGNAILSTEPLTDLEAIELPFERQRRVAIQATVTLLDDTGHTHALRLTNVHLENVGARRRLGVFAPWLRDRQVAALLDRLPPDGPAVLAGDLNTWLGRMEPAYKRLRREFDPLVHSDTRPTFGGMLRLDHVFTRLPDAWEAGTVRLDRFGSDHHALMTRLRLVGDSTHSPSHQ